MHNIVMLMKKCLLLIAIISLQSFRVKAQVKMVFDVNAGINKSIGSNLLKTQTISGNNIEYYSRQRYKHPQGTITGSALFQISKDFFIGLRSGIYMYILEDYATIAQRTTLSLPLLLTGRLNLFKINKNSAGIDLSGRINYFHIDDIFEKYGSGTLLNGSIFYLVKEKYLLKIGLEQQTDKVQFDIYQMDPNSSVRFLNYKFKGYPCA